MHFHKKFGIYDVKKSNFRENVHILPYSSMCINLHFYILFCNLSLFFSSLIFSLGPVMLRNNIFIDMDASQNKLHFYHWDFFFFCSSVGYDLFWSFVGIRKCKWAEFLNFVNLVEIFFFFIWIWLTQTFYIQRLIRRPNNNSSSNNTYIYWK